jgi:hypothetical protein
VGGCPVVNARNYPTVLVKIYPLSSNAAGICPEVSGFNGKIIYKWVILQQAMELITGGYQGGKALVETCPCFKQFIRSQLTKKPNFEWLSCNVTTM